MFSTILMVFIWLYLLDPVNWIICLVVVGALWKVAHPVAVVMMSTVVSTVIGEGIRTGFRFHYDTEAIFTGKVLLNLFAFLIIGSIVATTIRAVLRLRR